MRSDIRFIIGQFAAFILLIVASPVMAQQTIINAPSVDQTKQGRFFFLHESQLRSWDDNSYWLTTNFLTYGVTDRFELALTTYNIGSPTKPNQAIAPGWKTAQPVWSRRLPEWEIKLGAGQMMPINLQGQGVGLWSFGQVSFRLPPTGTRLTGGVSHGPNQLFGRDTTHFVGSIEQPLDGLGARIGGALGDVVGDMAIVGEWFAGKHEFGDFVPGLNWHNDDGWVVIMGYKFSNKPGRKDDGIIFEIGKTF
ncbi:hypothetical protein ACFOON_04830 [Novosphingobium piscinae]|uniref:Uncharacterized protein n=1 Tax=Novosphingobium piscinae TaxID=1507448 RepID=A0A7X1KPE2_9SPHN|nr:hypothetical protein [Novosphingobium piscinae]MBC2668295.1 hypothetical protein [Novosphingobium piscinae]